MEPLLAICSHRDTLSIAFLILVFLHFLYIKKLSVFFNVCIIVLAKILRYPQACFFLMYYWAFSTSYHWSSFQNPNAAPASNGSLTIKFEYANKKTSVIPPKRNRPSHLILTFLQILSNHAMPKVLLDSEIKKHDAI